MNLEETHALLTFAASIDNRKFDDATVIGWQAVLGEVDGADAMRAAIRHYGTSHDYLTPAHIRDAAKVAAEKRERESLRGHVRRRLDRVTEASGAIALPVATSSTDRSDEVRALIQAVTNSLPKMDAHAKAVARAQQERGRAEKPPVRARKRHTTPMKWPKPADPSIAALATRYLIDGYQPSAVSSMLGVSQRWCEKTAARLHGAPA